MDARIGAAAACAAFVVLASSARADVPLAGPVVTAGLRLLTPDTDHEWIAWPVFEGRGEPVETYTTVRTGAELALGGARIWAFPSDHDPLPAIDSFPSADQQRSLRAFFDAQHVPRSEPIPPIPYERLLALNVGHVVDVYEPRIVGDRVELHLLRSEYSFVGRDPETVEAREDGTRVLPDPPRAVAQSSGCGCRAAPLALGPLGAVFVALGAVALAATRRR